MQCANGDNSDSDFFGLNSYSWCGGSATFESAGYNTLVDMFKSTSVPVFFSEYGCNEVMPRVFDEVAALYGDQMRSLSGGLVFEYSQEPNNFGLTEINSDGTVKLLADYDNLQKQYAKLDMAKIQSADPTQTNVARPKCDAKLITNSAFDTNFTVPAVCPDCDALIKNGIASPTNGKIVEVKDTKSTKACIGTDGKQVQDFTLKALPSDASNAPNGQSISNPTVNSPSSSNSSSTISSGNSTASSGSSGSVVPPFSNSTSSSLTNGTTAPQASSPQSTGSVGSGSGSSSGAGGGAGAGTGSGLATAPPSSSPAAAVPAAPEQQQTNAGVRLAQRGGVWGVGVFAGLVAGAVFML